MSIKTFFYRDSSFIINVSWDTESDSLLVQFNSGTTWVYYNVPQKIYKELIKSISVGQYFNKNIRSKFTSERINYPIEGTIPNVQKKEA